MTRQWSKGERWLLFGSGGLCLLALVTGWIYQRQNELPPPPAEVVEVPPDNNAFDVLMQASALAPVRPKSTYVGAACRASNIDREYTCGSAFDQPEPYTPRYNRAFPLTRKVAYLKSAQQSLKLWRSSLSLPLYVPEKASRSQLRLVIARFHELAFVQARFCWQSGDCDGALDWLLACHYDLCRTKRTFFNGQFHAVEIDQELCGAQKFLDVLDELEHLMPHLNARQLRRASLALSRNRALVPSRVEAALRAREKDRVRLYRACATNDVFQLARPDREWPQGTALPLRFRWANKKNGIEHIGKQWDWVIAQMQKPYPGSPLEVTVELPPQLVLSDGEPFAPAQVWWGLIGYAPNVEAHEKVLLTAMAVRAFELEQGHLPRQVGELVPRYLRKVEDDPFRPKHSLVYSSSPKTYTQWYVGKPIYTKKLPPNTVAVPPYSSLPSNPLGGPVPKVPTGYYVTCRVHHLPFLLYSVGINARDEGGLDLKAVSAKPFSTAVGPLSNGPSFHDDVLAPVEWFDVAAEAMKDYDISKNLARP